MAPVAPERTFNIEEIFPFYNFFLVDNCLLHPDCELAENLYDVRHPDQLLRLTPRLQELVQHLENMQKYIVQRGNFYITPYIKEEIMPFITHIRQVAAFNQSRLPNEKDWKYKKSRPQFKRYNKRHNKFLERQRDEDIDIGEYKASVHHTLDLMQRAIDSLTELYETFPLYHHSDQLPRLPSLKASVTDAHLVGALINYAQRPENRKNKAAILTADGDVIKLFHTHLQTMGPVQQLDLSSRVAIHFRENNAREYIRYGFNPSYKVREAVG